MTRPSRDAARAAFLASLFLAAIAACNSNPPPANAEFTRLRDDSASIHAPPGSPDHPAPASAFPRSDAGANSAPMMPLREGNPNAPASIATCANDWLGRHNLNEYGDPPGTMYPGGTPLFNERTGVRTDRFDYLFAKNAELRASCGPASKPAEPAGNPY